MSVIVVLRSKRGRLDSVERWSSDTRQLLSYNGKSKRLSKTR